MMGMSQPEVQRPAGWTVFVGAILLLVGCFNVIWGLMALIRPRIITVSTQNVVILDIKSWGWAYIVVGALMVVASVGLLTLHSWGRWLAIGFATFNALILMAYFTAYPLWSLLMIVLNIVVIHQLSSRWQQPLTERQTPGAST